MIVESLLPLGKLDPGLRIEFSTPVEGPEDVAALREILSRLR